MLINIDAEDPVAAFWHELCLNYSPSGIPKDADGNELLITEQKGIKKVFTSEIIVCKRCYDSTLGAMINTYSICDELFAALFVSDLQSASYIAEDENGENLYLGPDIWQSLQNVWLTGHCMPPGWS